MLHEKFNDNFIIVSELGEGSYGKVYKCLDKKTKQHVAVKKVKLEEN